MNYIIFALIFIQALMTNSAYGNEQALITAKDIRGSLNEIKNPTYTAVYKAGFNIDAAGYIQPGITGNFTLTYNSKVAHAQSAEYYTVFPSTQIPALMSKIKFKDLNNSYMDFYNLFYSGKKNVPSSQFVGNQGKPLTSIELPLATNSPASQWAFMHNIEKTGAQPCGAKATACNFTADKTTVVDTFKGWNYPLPTFVPATGLTYYVLLVHVDTVSKTPSFAVFSLTLKAGGPD